jgi:LacI family transcriptional regulator
MEELDYHPNAVAQSLRTRKTHAIGAVVSDITNPFFATLVRGAEDAAIEAGYSLIVCNSDESSEKEDRYVRLLRRRRMDGLLISPVGDGSTRAVQELPRWQIPFVFIDRRAKGIDADAVLSDNVDGAYQATKHLIDRGHHRIGIILGIEGATTTEERLAGYRRALDEADILFSDELVTYGGYRVEGGRKKAEDFLSLPEPPSGIFSTNNLMTVGVLRALVYHRIAIPRGMAVVSFDDLDLGELFQPPLTAVTQNPYEVGKIAIEILLSRFENREEGASREIRVPVELRVRGST